MGFWIFKSEEEKRMDAEIKAKKKKVEIERERKEFEKKLSVFMEKSERERFAYILNKLDSLDSDIGSVSSMATIGIVT